MTSDTPEVGLGLRHVRACNYLGKPIMVEILNICDLNNQKKH
jgi:hypothetical protein